jgi:rod shape-determining protein MreD
MILQLTVVPLFAITDVFPDLIVIMVLSTTLRHGRILGISYGFAAGLVLDCFGTGLVGLSSLAYAVSAYLFGILAEEQLERRFTVFLGVLLGALLAHDILYFFVLAIGTDTGVWRTIFWYVIPRTAYTTVFVMIMHLIMPKTLWGRRQTR